MFWTYKMLKWRTLGQRQSEFRRQNGRRRQLIPSGSTWSLNHVAKARKDLDKRKRFIRMKYLWTNLLMKTTNCYKIDCSKHVQIFNTVKFKLHYVSYYIFIFIFLRRLCLESWLLCQIRIGNFYETLELWFKKQGNGFPKSLPKTKKRNPVSNYQKWMRNKRKRFNLPDCTTWVFRCCCRRTRRRCRMDQGWPRSCESRLARRQKSS